MLGLPLDLRHSLRSLLRRPGFTLAAVLTLALGIGANTAIFSFVNGILLAPTPFRDVDRLVRIESVRGTEPGRVSMSELADLRERTGVFEDVAAYIPGAQYNMSGGGTPEELGATLCTTNLFSVLGVLPARGASWPAASDRSRNFEVVLTDALWKRKFNGDPAVIGTKITLDAAPFYTIHGVLPPDVAFPTNVQLFRSISVNQSFPSYSKRDDRVVYGVGRLKPGVTVERARSALRTVGLQLAEQYPDTTAKVGFTVTPVKDLYVGDVRPYLLVLAGAVGFVLLIACANVMNLLLVRALARERDVAVRRALGAGSWRIVAHQMVETLILGLAGGSVGLAFGAGCVALLSRAVGVDLPVWMRIGLDGRVLAFTFVVSVAAGLLAGVMPAIQVLRPNLAALLNEGARGATGGARHRFGRALVVTEIALALVLLVGAGLMAQSFLNLRRVEMGFNSANLLTVRIALPWRKFAGDAGPDAMARFFDRTIGEIGGLPGVTAVAATSNLPLSGETQLGRVAVTIEGQSATDHQANPLVNEMAVSPNYFQVMGIPLLRGRAPADSDTRATDRVYVVSERFAKRFFGDGDPLGRRVKVGPPSSDAAWGTIVGIARDVRHDAMTDTVGLDLYASYRQIPDGSMFLVVRAAGNPLALAEPVTRTVWRVDPDQSTFNIATMEQRLSDSVWQRRVTGQLFVLFSVLALALAAIGIYGVMSFTVGRRMREFGIRLSLGASVGDVLKLVLGQGVRLASLGIILGLLGAYGLARAIRHLLFGVEALDPATYAVVALVLAAVALSACYFPARRATRVDPTIVLRSE